MSGRKQRAIGVISVIIIIGGLVYLFNRSEKVNRVRTQIQSLYGVWEGKIGNTNITVEFGSAPPPPPPPGYGEKREKRTYRHFEAQMKFGDVTEYLLCEMKGDSAINLVSEHIDGDYEGRIPRHNLYGKIYEEETSIKGEYGEYKKGAKEFHETGDWYITREK